MLLFLLSIPALMDCAPSKLGLSRFCLLINVLFPQKTIESETVKTSEVIKKKLGEITGTVKEVQGLFLRAALLRWGFWGAGIGFVGAAVPGGIQTLQLFKPEA